MSRFFLDPRTARATWTILVFLGALGQSAVFLATGVPYALVLAGIGGALRFIPVIGPLAAGVVSIGVSLFSGYAHPWLLPVFVLVWRGIQDDGTSPLVMARSIEIHPALVIFGVLAGGEIAGVAGMFLSLPVIAAALTVPFRWKLFGEQELPDAVRNAVGVDQGPLGGRDRVA